MEEVATDLAKDIHRQAQCTDTNFDAAEDDEQSLDASRKDPGISKVCQNERKHILENNETGEGFNRNISVRIK